MHMIHACGSLDQFHCLHLAQFSDDFNQIFPHLPVEYFLAIFGNEYDMICAIPFGMSYTIVVHLDSSFVS